MANDKVWFVYKAINPAQVRKFVGNKNVESLYKSFLREGNALNCEEVIENLSIFPFPLLSYIISLYCFTSSPLVT